MVLGNNFQDILMGNILNNLCNRNLISFGGVIHDRTTRIENTRI